MGTKYQSTPRRFLLAANWKMHKGPVETAAFFDELAREVGSSVRSGIIFVPAFNVVTAVAEARRIKTSSSPVSFEIGVQNIFHEKQGAFTGENSPEIAKAIGCSWALVGHSERRIHFGETDVATGKKVRTALDCGLSAMLCVGESLAERDDGRTLSVVERQLAAGLQSLSAADWAHIAIAYEPVWAIGTGKVASPEQASEVHTAIRHWLTVHAGRTIAEQTSILYGGSAKPENFREIAARENIDGFLIGGASLEASSFARFLV